MNKIIRIISSIMIVSWMSIGVASADSIQQSVVGSIDTFIAQVSSDNSGESTELDWVNKTLFGLDTTQYFSSFIKTESDDSEWKWYEVYNGANVVGGTYAFEFQTVEPEYFLIKIGNGKDKIDTFLFRNVASLDWAVVNLTLASGFEIKNVGKFSHIDEFGSTPVPEPATMLLFGTGLVGLAGLARRKK